MKTQDRIRAQCLVDRVKVETLIMK